jgi:hypothetical protein
VRYNGRVRPIALLVLAFGFGGCALGAEQELDAGKTKFDFGLADTSDDGGDADLIPPDTTADDAADAEDTTPLPDTAPADTGCVPACTTTCGAADGCGGKCATGTCAGGGTCLAGACVKPTNSYLSPGSYVGSATAYARAAYWTLASETPSKIFYTLDGTAPDATSTSKASPFDLHITTSGTKIRWYADNGVKEASAHSFVANIDSALQSTYNYVVEHVTLDGTGPVVVVAPGAIVSGSASYQAWVGSGCPGCRMQLVYGIGTTEAGCLYDWSPGVWPGASGSYTTIKATAPSTAGVYKLNVAYSLELVCSDALAKSPLSVRPSAQVATIVVK